MEFVVRELSLELYSNCFAKLNGPSLKLLEMLSAAAVRGVLLLLFSVGCAYMIGLSRLKNIIYDTTKINSNELS